MRLSALTLASSVAVIGIAVTSGVRADAVKASPELTVFTDERTDAAGKGLPTVLRGSAVRRGSVDGRFGRTSAPAGFQLDAGAKLWLTDPIGGQVIVCDERNRGEFGGSFVGCVEDRLPY